MKKLLFLALLFALPIGGGEYEGQCDPGEYYQSDEGLCLAVEPCDAGYDCGAYSFCGYVESLKKEICLAH